MGFRTIVVLNNDRANEWANDPTLGQQIQGAMNHAMGVKYDPRQALEGGYGNVASCQHADVQMLVAVNHFSVEKLATTHWHSGQKPDEVSLNLLREAAEKLGYKLVKKG